MTTQQNKQVNTNQARETTETAKINKLESECLQKDLERIKLANAMLKKENSKLTDDLKHCNQLIIQKDVAIQLKDEQIAKLNQSDQDQYQTQLYETQQQLTYYFNESVQKNSKIQQLFLEIQSLRFDHQQQINELNNSLIEAQNYSLQNTAENDNLKATNDRLLEKNKKLKQMIDELEDVNTVRLGIIDTLKKDNVMLSENESVYKQKRNELQQTLSQKNKQLQTKNDKLKELNVFVKRIEWDKIKHLQKNKDLITEYNKIFEEFNELISKKEIAFKQNVDKLYDKIKELENRLIDYENKENKSNEIQIRFMDTSSNKKYIDVSKTKNRKKRSFNEYNKSSANNYNLLRQQNKRQRTIKSINVTEKELNPLWENNKLLTKNDIKKLEQDDIFLVEKILDHKMVNKTKNEYGYQVKWTGYKNSTWEPEININPSAIKDYWEKKKK